MNSIEGERQQGHEMRGREGDSKTSDLEDKTIVSDHGPKV